MPKGRGKSKRFIRGVAVRQAKTNASGWINKGAGGAVSRKFYESISKNIRGLFAGAGNDESSDTGRSLKRIINLKFQHEEEVKILKKAKILSEINIITKRLISENERQTYNSAVVKMYNDYEQMVFNLSEQSTNETLESIKNMTLAQRLKFSELIVKRNQRTKSKYKNAEAE